MYFILSVKPSRVGYLVRFLLIFSVIISRFILKRLFQYQAAAEAGVFQAPPYAPFPPDILPPVMLPPFAMDKPKVPKVKAKRTAAKPKAEKEPKSSTSAAAKAQKAATDTPGLY